MENLKRQDIPQRYPLCYVAQCPQSGQCLHYLACQLFSDSITYHPCVLPSAIAEGRSCPHFKALRVIRGAWGFKKPFAEVKQKDDGPLRAQIKSFLGGNGTYYRYHHGDRLLTPEQQQAIGRIFASRGYSSDVEFDGYRDAYDFTGFV